MDKFSTKDYIIISVFLVISLIWLWLISPLGKLYLPISASLMEDQLGIKLDNSYKLLSNKDGIYNLLVENKSPHIVSIILLNNPIDKADLHLTNISNEKIKSFWIRTGFSNPKVDSCTEKKFSNNTGFICKIEVTKEELNSKTLKEGTLSLLYRNSDVVFVASIASKGSYNNNLIVTFLEKISQK